METSEVKSSQVVVRTGAEGQKFEVHAHVEKPTSPYAGVSMKITTTYEDSRAPNEHRTVFQQHFPTQGEYDKFVAFLASHARRWEE